MGLRAVFDLPSYPKTLFQHPRGEIDFPQHLSSNKYLIKKIFILGIPVQCVGEMRGVGEMIGVGDKRCCFLIGGESRAVWIVSIFGSSGPWCNFVFAKMGKIG